METLSINEGLIIESAADPLNHKNANREREELKEIEETVYDLIRTIRDPEKLDQTLEDLSVVSQDLIQAHRGRRSGITVTTIAFVPTVPHCSLATLIGLCIRTKLNRELPEDWSKIDIFIKEGTHETEQEINKQINDKERVAAAMENPNLARTVEECISDN